MTLIIYSCLIMIAGGILSLAFSSDRRLSSWSAAAGVSLGCAVAALPVADVLAGAHLAPVRAAWSVPWGSFFISLDGLSAFFCLPVIILSPIAAIYGCGYMAHEKKPAGASWFFYSVLVASMILLIVSSNGMLFLMAWEIMALSSFFLVIFHDEDEKTRKAAWTYLVASHIGAACLLAFFALSGYRAGSLDFDKIIAAGFTPAMATALFTLAVLGFGAKAGFMPMHVWLPEAHPAAPSHVSALMSGAMIKMGIYGLLRGLTFLGHPQEAWGWVLLASGITSGVLGAALALGQSDIKRMLAYSSVENIGIIAMGAGLGLLGMSWKQPHMAALGFGGAMLHTLNHSLFKGLLFLGAGSVAHGTGTRNMDLLGGLLKRMPWTGAAVLAGCAAISALPPFNGFAGEFMIYASGFKAALFGLNRAVVAAGAAVAGLALIGGLAAAGFARCGGIVFLGEPRGEEAANAREAPASMWLPQLALAAACLAGGLFSPVLARLLFHATPVITGGSFVASMEPVRECSKSLASVAAVSFALLFVVAILYAARRALSAGRREDMSPTWDCGYAKPTARMQYTATSFSSPLLEIFRDFLGTKISSKRPKGYFPVEAAYSTSTPDQAVDKFFDPLFRSFGRAMEPLRIIQHGKMNIYILYIAATLIALLLWKVGVF